MTASQNCCPVEFTLLVLGGKWKTVILARLKVASLRYSDLRRLLPRLSEKVLTQRLRELVEDGLVERVSNASDEPRRYQLTSRGTSLAPVLQAMYDWGEQQENLQHESPA